MPKSTSTACMWGGFEQVGRQCMRFVLSVLLVRLLTPGDYGTDMVSLEAKKDLVPVAPDPSPYRERVLDLLAMAWPWPRVHAAQGIRFEEYLKLARSAKWSLTFGEGLDDDFTAVALGGGVGFAVYNEDFFAPEYRSCAPSTPVSRYYGNAL
jgi:hypothetical protein